MKDLIERQKAIDALDKHLRTTDVPISYPGIISALTEWLNELPSAQPEPCEDAVSREAAIDVAENAFVRGLLASPDIRRLPSAQPERKKGKWQITDAYPHNVYCSECHTRFAQTHWAVWEDGSLPRNFCPNCGADMREDQHDQSK